MAQCLRYVCEAHQRELTDTMLAVYFDQLGELDPVRFAECCRQLVRESSRFPSVAELRMAYFAGTRRIDPTLQRNMSIGRKVREARKLGQTAEQVDELIERLERQTNEC
ncbi:MAG: hypothetical protein R3C03_09385 [Pirellulaceae bacterium]